MNWGGKRNATLAGEWLTAGKTAIFSLSIGGSYMFPDHGKIECRLCFKSGESICNPHPKWRMRNDPGAWGSSSPEILVLGFSKGSTQADIYQTGRFEDVAFGGQARSRLDRVLKQVGLISGTEHVSNLIGSADQSRFAFGSLVRCSLSRVDDSTGEWKTSGSLITKSHREIPEVLGRCSQQYLAHLPATTKLVVMLGVTDAYIKMCFALMRALDDQSVWINPVAYRSQGRLFVHLTHPSPGNGTFHAWINGAQKQLMATKAIEEFQRGK